MISNSITFHMHKTCNCHKPHTCRLVLELPFGKRGIGYLCLYEEGELRRRVEIPARFHLPLRILNEDLLAQLGKGSALEDCYPVPYVLLADAIRDRRSRIHSPKVRCLINYMSDIRKLLQKAGWSDGGDFLITVLNQGLRLRVPFCLWIRKAPLVQRR